MKKWWQIAALAVMLLLCSACGAEAPAAPEDSEPPIAEETLPEQPMRPVPEEQTAPEETSSPDAFSFAEVANVEFYFSSGAGAWHTELRIQENGTFDGLYIDTDMGDLDEAAYPNGTRYYNSFTGRFTEPEQVNDYIWRMQVAELNLGHPIGEELLDGFRYVYSEANGISGAEDVYLYLPGAPLAELPEGYRGWVGYYDLTQTEETELPFYGLYNEAQESGFSGYPAPQPAELLQAELKATESLAAEAEQNLQAATTQTDMNLAAEELYRIWDDMLNITWMYLKEGLDHDTMQQLTAEQLTWINEKEAAAAAAGAEYEGGSMQGMTVNLEAAELTRQRVYELTAYWDYAK